MTGYCIYWDRHDHKSGGIRALHVLRDELRERGHEAFMFYEQPYDTAGAIVVYPEVIKDNPLRAKRVVRWLLNTGGVPDDGPRYAWTRLISDDPLLTVNIIEPELWHPYDGPREGVAYWVGKGVVDESVLPAGAVAITRDNYPTRPELAAFVRQLDYAISFDPFSAFNQECVNSGTPVVIVAPPGAQEAIGRAQMNYGVAWGVDELDKARSDVHLAWADYEDQKRVFKRRVRDFVRDTQKM